MVLALLSLLARADIPPPDIGSCGGASAGDPCTVDGQEGTCVEATRTRATHNGPVESSYLACRAASPAAPKPAEPKASRCQSAPGWPWLALLLLPLLRRR